MRTEQPNVIENARYELRETAEALGVNASTITRWTRAGLMRCQIRKTNRRQVWTGAEIIRIWRSCL